MAARIGQRLQPRAAAKMRKGTPALLAPAITPSATPESRSQRSLRLTFLSRVPTTSGWQQCPTVQTQTSWWERGMFTSAQSLPAIRSFVLTQLLPHLPGRISRTSTTAAQRQRHHMCIPISTVSISSSPIQRRCFSQTMVASIVR